MPSCAYAALNASELVEKHERTVQAMGDFRVSVISEVSIEGEEGDGGRFQPMMSIDWVRVGGDSRFTSRTFAYLNAERKLIIVEKPRHFDLSFNDKDVRTLENWNPNESVPLPLKPGGLNASDFSSKKGAIYPLDFTSPPSSPVLYWLLFRPDVTHDLAALVDSAAEVRVLGNDAHPIIELESEGGEVQRLTFAPKHGYLVSTAERFNSKELLLSKVEVTEFVETDTQSWFPHRSVLSGPGHRTVRARVEQATFGTPIPRNEAIVQFPDGARVDNPVEKVIHIWGSRDRPVYSFSEFDDFAAWEARTARANAPRPGTFSQFGASPVFWANVALVVLIAVLLVARRYAA